MLRLSRESALQKPTAAGGWVVDHAVRQPCLRRGLTLSSCFSPIQPSRCLSAKARGDAVEPCSGSAS